MKEERIEFSTKKEVNQIIELLRDFAQQEKKVTIEPIEREIDPFGQEQEKMDIEVLLTGQLSILHNKWAVQVYVEDFGSQRNVILIALGTSALAIYAGAYAAAASGRGNALAFAPDFKDSKKMQQKIAELLS